jgi:hypothetical protein
MRTRVQSFMSCVPWVIAHTDVVIRGPNPHREQSAPSGLALGDIVYRCTRPNRRVIYGLPLTGPAIVRVDVFRIF